MGTVEAAPARSLKTTLLERARAVDWVPWIESLKLVITTRVIFFILAYAGTWLFATSTTGPPTDGFLDTWTRWDAVHFIHIADYGYRGPQSDTHATAFFPLFPLLERTGSLIGVSAAAMGMVISGISSVVAGTFLYRLAQEEIGDGSGRSALLYLLLFPTSVFLIAPYSEALFLAGAIPAFYYARRKQWLMVGLPAAVAVGARAAGIFLLAGLFVEFLRHKDFKLDNVLNAATGLLLGGLPLLAYGVFLARVTGNPLHFLVDQSAGWGRNFVGPVSAFMNTWNTWNSSYFTNWMFAWRLEIVTALAGAGVTIWAMIKKEWGYATYMGLGLAALVTSSWYYSIPRVVLTWFPIALFMAGATAGKDRAHELVLLTLAPIAALGVLLYTRNIWFF